MTKVWILFAFGSALFAGITSVLAKIGIKNINSDLATALRTIIVMLFAWLMVFIVGSQPMLLQITPRSLLFLVLSGLATGGSWLCYYKAIQLGDVSKVVPIDKSSTILTMLLAFIFLGEELTLIKALAMVLIFSGTCIMVAPGKNGIKGNRSNAWILFALLSAMFASLTAILAKIGIAEVESNLGTAIRTTVVLIMAWLFVFFKGAHREIGKINKRGLGFICLSGLATGLSWLCFYRALQAGPASIVVPIDKLSILITAAFGRFVLKERITKKSSIGLVTIVTGTLCLLIS